MSGNSMHSTTDVLVVGAGITGLMAAYTLQKAGLRVLVLDKGRGVGGRLATRRIGPGYADHGAQFFTVRSPEFRKLVKEWLAEERVFVWGHGWSDGSIVPGPKDGHSPHSDGHPRYAMSGGMTSIPKYLATHLNTDLEVHVSQIMPKDGGWEAVSRDGRKYYCRAVILTPPVPQSLALLAAGNTMLHRDDQSSLTRLTYAPCLCGLFWVEGKVHLPEPGALQRPFHPISWIADNQRKGISPDATLITMHGNPIFSQAHFNTPEADVLDLFQASLKNHMAADAVVLQAQLKKWRFSLPTALFPERTLVARDLPPLAFAGDAFKEPRVEGAVLSGLAAAQAIKAGLVV